MKRQCLFLWGVFVLLPSLFARSLGAACPQYVASDGSVFEPGIFTKKGGYTFTPSSGNPIYGFNYCDVAADLPGEPACTPANSAYVFLVNGTNAAGNRKCYIIGSTSYPYNITDGNNGPGTGVQIIYKNGGCTATLRLVCNPNVPTLTVTGLTPQPAQCNYVITAHSKQACRKPGTGKSGGKKRLSGGSVFLIIFFVSAAVYLIVGVIVKWKVMHVPVGVELIPNINFWREIPGLIADGFRFTRDKTCNRGYYERIGNQL